MQSKESTLHAPTPADNERLLSRRSFLGLGVVAGALGLLGSAGCSRGPLRTGVYAPYRASRAAAAAAGRAAAQGQVALVRDPTRDLSLVCRDLVARVSDLAWLRPGDSVFLKVASNSGYAHPRVTHPDTVRAMVALLRERGAGTIWVGDQAGVEHVRRTQEVTRSSTRERMGQNGLLTAITDSGATPFFFDETPWDDFFQPEADFPDHWGRALWLPRIVEQTDHIVYLPRLAAHATAGYTAGIKIAVGWLRDDSRLSLHQRGDVFYERIAEISHFRPLRDKLRLVLTLGTQALLDIGPDLGSTYDFQGVCGLASTRLVDHDATVAALLPWLDQDATSFFDIYNPYPHFADFWNRDFVQQIWGQEAVAAYRGLVPFRFEQGLAHDVFTAHLARLQGYHPNRIRILGGEGLAPGLVAHLREHDGGLFEIGGQWG